MKETNKVSKWIKFVLVNGLICLGFFLLSQVPSFLSAVLLMIYGKKIVYLDVLFTIIWLVITYFIASYIWKYYKEKNPEDKIQLTLKDIGISFGYFLTGSLITFIGGLSMEFVYGTSESQNDEMIQMLIKKSPSIWFVFVMIIQLTLLAPILEELVIRGIPKVTLFKDSPNWFMLVMTSLFFSSLHQSTNIISFLIYAALGGVMCHAYLRRGRIIDSMMVHFFNNLLATIAFLFLI
ncbi:type II CAAX endopeptidase family protein [Vagococcus carniphilus]|uniref:Type II CAAX endopeptidase family protein n=1 Tax=Vagococcus carniphilus TaxID=218144 RepID=A0AAW8TZA5_9ENTE|nr:type II CAAX endopeptidase family protein [Vagococcus carniphilus]MDT2816027.1 type II CAAX endopeptidase family protein [Vagococcus carniphilus]MDT2832646.1 type II CAAX endopeptidase family protein [Vagococcus carniphilus]